MAGAGKYGIPASMAEFLATGAGVRGLVESGVTSVPPFFEEPCSDSTTALSTTLSVPTVDLSGPRSATVAAVGAAARSCGFFNVINHGVDDGAVVSAVQAFHELPRAVRSALYTLMPVGGICYSTVPNTGGQYADRLLSWRDYLRVLLQNSPPPDVGCIPAFCRHAMMEYRRRIDEFGKEITGLLSEALGVGAERLHMATQVEAWVMTGHYYPPCPEPERVVGAAEHTDPSMYTVLAQDHVGGLQVRLHDGGWADVQPVPGALLVNIGDVLKLVSNDEYKSVEHRVRIKSSVDPRVSVATFFNPAKCGDSRLLGPLPELVTLEKPARYRNFTMTEFLNTRAEFGHSSCSTDHFRVPVE
uniref:Uncharacterized protein n=1 Tax=Avena sativa TaxID=4498 RepID=A0ACD5UFT9_AVESA